LIKNDVATCHEIDVANLPFRPYVLRRLP